MKIGNIAKIPTRDALRLILLVDELGLYYSHFDGKLECERCGWGVELHRRSVGGRDPHFEHRDDGPLCLMLK